MATVANTASTVNRLTGMYSGMDTDALVKAMLSSQQTKLDKMNQTLTRAEWKRDMINDFNNQLRIFKDEFTSVAGANSLMSKGSFFDFSVTNETNTLALGVKASASAKAGTYKVDIHQIATAAQMTSTKLTNSATGLTSTQLSSTQLKDFDNLISGPVYGDSEGNVNFKLNGVEFSFKNTDTLKTVMDTVNKSKAGVTMQYSQISDKITITNNTLGEYRPSGDIGPEPEKPQPFMLIEPEPGGAGYTEAKAAYDAALKDYNENVLKPYNELYAVWKEESDEAASANKKTITFEDTDGFLGSLGLGNVVNGQDAIISVNGGESMSYDTNSVNLDGIVFELKDTTGGSTAAFTIERNVQSSVDKITKFVESFNELVSNLWKANNSKKNYSFNPLTDAQKEQMTESEITAWEEEAKAGTLYRDNNLDTMLNKLRSALSANLGGEGGLASIGITVPGYSSTDPWELKIDTEKLTAALQEDPDKVYNMFSMSDKSDESKNGFITRINSAMDTFSSQTKSNVIQALNNDIVKYTKSIAEQEKKMETESEKYYVKYAALETALGKMQSQSDQLANLFGTSG